MNPIEAEEKTLKGSRLSIRATDEEKHLLERAARASHVSASRFVMQAALRSAEEVLVDQSRFTLPPAQWAAFTELTDRPAREIPALKRAAGRPSPFDGE
ncbi:MAG: DUF1778 domain-containing protein [Coriobacteriia bacterium]|nr:DUF1778 domain-containing protein [Coriobacteriia bacterium]